MDLQTIDSMVHIELTHRWFATPLIHENGNIIKHIILVGMFAMTQHASRCRPSVLWVLMRQMGWLARRARPHLAVGPGALAVPVAALAGYEIARS